MAPEVRDAGRTVASLDVATGRFRERTQSKKLPMWSLLT